MNRCSALPLAFVLLAVAIRSALAHATVIGCSPPIGANLTAPPAQIECQFSEPLDPTQSALVVTDARGERVDRGDTRLAAKDATKLAVSLDTAKMTNGLYTVRWSVINTIDEMLTQGEFQFGVNTAVPPTPTAVLPNAPLALYASQPDPYLIGLSAGELVARFLIATGVGLLGAVGLLFWQLHRAEQQEK